jgi:FkbM family methyltransferase
MMQLRDELAALLEKANPPEEQLASSCRIVVYGAGGAGRKVAELAQRNGLEVAAFLDGRGAAAGALEPRSSEAAALANSADAAVIGIFNFTTDVRPVVQLLHELGFQRVLTYPEFHEIFGEADDYWLTKRAFYSGRAEEVLRGFDLLGDEVSRRVYIDCIALRLTGNPQLLATPDTERQYLPADLPAPQQPMRLIDGGAFTGDTLSLFLQHNVEIEAAAAFEPDLQNYARLCANAPRDRIRELILLPCGLDETTAMSSFHSGAGAASGIGSGGETHIQTVALDDVLPAFAPTFIKLDIEGAELRALRGAARTIREHRPTLAVCAYHEPQHLWTVPQLLHELLPDARIALRYHGWNGFDVVAYALPQ